MRLHEFESKQIIKKYGVDVPESVLISSITEITPAEKPLVVKAQLLTVKSRAKAGAVKICNSYTELLDTSRHLLNREIEGETAKHLLFEEKIDIVNEYYIGITYDTTARTPVVIFSKSGGVDVESAETEKIHVNTIHGLHDWMIRDMLRRAGIRADKIIKLSEIIKRAYKCFINEDCKTLEINPIAETSEGCFVAVDAFIELDGDAVFRHKERTFSERSYKPLTQRELAVKKVNAIDYKGTVKYIELDGDIGFLAAGGGGSLTCMDALIKCGGLPSNYTEYSGNPSAEKVYELTKQILSKPGLRGLWIVGAIANFTRVDTTMEGITRALAEIKPQFPIVVRRSGPFEKEGLDMLRKTALEHNLNMQIFGKEFPMTESAQIMVESANKYTIEVEAV